MRFAYADPPYPGQAKRWYRDHPDYAGEVDHAKLIDRLNDEYPDGWALSTSAAALQQVLALCPLGVRVAVWYRRNNFAPQHPARWQWMWEPVIIWGGRRNIKDAPVVKDVLEGYAPRGFLGRGLAGAKPPAFTRWVVNLLGATPDDTVDDLFPGSGAVGSELAAIAAQPQLPL